MRSVTWTMLAVAMVSEHDEHTQAQTVQTLRGLNETAIAHAKALDPRRFTELVAVHQELIEKIAAAERRVLEHDREQTVEHAVKALKAALDLVSYVPPERRSQAIAAIPESMQPSFLQVAATAPDLSCSPLTRLELELGGLSTMATHVYRHQLKAALELPPPLTTPPPRPPQV
jgi:hypothetical protein